MRHATWLGVLLACASCGLTAGPRSPRIAEILPAAPDPLPAAPALRLPPGVRPTHYTLDLTVDPGAKTFGGQVIIDVELDQASDFIWLSSAELTIDRAHVSFGGATTPVRPITSGEGAEFVGLAFGRPVGPGPAKLTIDYQGTFARGGIGLFKAKDGPDWYAVTQFEATYARRTVPCFDEPGWKTPWSITLHIPPRDKAFANTPVENDAADGTMRVVKFAETKPLPSYLVAFAVGPFDIVDLGHAGKKNTPIRIIVPRGRAREAGWAAQITPELLTRLEGYFGTPYPYEKLDLLGIPITDFGAMENAGLITFDGPLLLGDPQAPSIHDQHETALTITHEMSHQWFGDLVTMHWWDDIWLNEGFANWMESKIVNEWKPEWKIAAEVINSTDDAMGIDALQGTRRVHEPVESHDDEVDAFDSITYEKGAAIISMIETWIGPDAFGRAVRAHLAKHAFGNATTADFIQAVNEAAGRDTAGVFGSFLDQPGVPLVTLKLSCPKDQPPRVELAQQRWRPAGAAAGQDDQRWKIPVCIRYGGLGGEARSCTQLDAATAEIVLPDARSCPAWVVGNDGAAGYYRVRYEGGMLAKLATRKELTLRERLALVNDLDALVSGGAIPADEVLATIAELVTPDTDPMVVAALVTAVDDFSKHGFVSEAMRPAFAAYVQKVFGERAHTLGWIAHPGEDEGTKSLRAELAPMVALRGDDHALAGEATTLAQKWLDDHHALDSDVRDGVLGVAAQHGDKALWDRLRAAAARAQSQPARVLLLGALTRFGDPQLVKAGLEAALTIQQDPREIVGIFRDAIENEAGVATTYAFVKDHFDELARRFPDDVQFRIFGIGRKMCTAAEREDFATFARAHEAKIAGGKRIVDQTLEIIDMCIAARKLEEPSTTAYLKGAGAR